MANPTELLSGFATLKATTTQQTLNLDPDRLYWLAHCGTIDDGTASDTPVYFAADDDVVATSAEGANKLVLSANLMLAVGPGVSELSFKLAAGAADQPVFMIGATAPKMGQW